MAGMTETTSARQDILNSAPSSELILGGWISEFLTLYFPAGLVANMPTYVAIIATFVIVRQRNSIEMLAGEWTVAKLTYGALLFASAMYFMLAAKSTVFLYFNF
jgi:hypothetical protein